MKKTVLAILLLISLTPAHSDIFLELHKLCPELQLQYELTIIDAVYIKHKQKHYAVYSEHKNCYTYPIEKAQVNALYIICISVKMDLEKIERTITTCASKQERDLLVQKSKQIETFFNKLQKLFHSKYNIDIENRKIK